MKMTKSEQALLSVKALKKEYPVISFSLICTTPLQLLIAAQCTDMQVYKVIPALFEHCPTLDDFINITVEKIETFIRPCGLHKTKARDIHAMCVMLKEKYNSIVPDNIDELIKLPGVGRKTANLVVGDVYHKPAIVTDTHCIRICRRLGLTDGNTPLKVEKQLRAILPAEESNDFCHRLVLHGRKICTARNPKCVKCCMKEFCEYA